MNRPRKDKKRHPAEKNGPIERNWKFSAALDQKLKDVAKSTKNRIRLLTREEYDELLPWIGFEETSGWFIYPYGTWRCQLVVQTRKSDGKFLVFSL